MSNTQASRKQQAKIAKIIAKTASISRPSVNFAKDRLDQLFLIPDLVWFGKGYESVAGVPES